jgi:ABC-2 type transport system ATP-binding protein
VGEHAHLRVVGTGTLTAFAERCRGLPGVVSATASAETVELVVTEARSVLAPVVQAAQDSDVAVASVDVVEPDLESVFLHLTGKALRD